MRDRSAAGALEVKRFATSGGAQIFQMPVQEFPGLWGYVYLVLAREAGAAFRVLIDSGSGFGDSNADLEAGLQAASDLSGEPVGLADLTHILITHGHIDHFGGLAYIRPLTSAKIGVHELDLRNLTNYEERLAVVGRRLEVFLAEAGVPPERRAEVIGLYKITKSLYQSVKVDFTYEAAGMQVGPFQMLHTPGHCAGHVVIRLHDLLFTGDHVLEHTSPHQSPERLTLSTGLEHYLRSLEELRAWAGEISLGLGGHEDLILDLPGRIDAIRELHRVRLERVLELLETPHTIAQVSRSLFGEVHGYNVLLALEEAGAHVEYLYGRGRLRISNLDELETSLPQAPILYQRL